MKKIYFRTDGNGTIGLGHVIRSLALADMLKDEFECHFIIRTPTLTLQKQILEVCNGIIELVDNSKSDIEEAQQIVATHLVGNEIIVLDGYHFNTKYQKILKSKGSKMVCIDDIYAYHFVADIIINHAIGVDISRYSRETYTKIYHGFNYCLLRSPFFTVSREEDIRNSIFICFGGADYHNITLKTLKAIIRIDEPTVDSVDIVIGAVNHSKDEILAFVQKNDLKSVSIHSNLSAHEMANLMSKNKLAIVPASTISMECFASQMKVLCGYYVDNQMDYYKKLANHNPKIITPAGDLTELSIEEFSKLIITALKNHLNSPVLIDNLVPKRYLKIFKELTIL